MEEKNTIINGYAVALANMVQSFISTSTTLNDSPGENAAKIATLDIILDGVRSQTVVLQNALDTYGG